MLELLSTDQLYTPEKLGQRTSIKYKRHDQLL